MSDAQTVVHCRGIKKDGTPCGGTFALSEDGYCIAHDPLRSNLRQEAIEKSVEVRSKRLDMQRALLPTGMPKHPPKTLDSCVQWSSWCAWAVAVGAIDANTARQITSAITALTGTLKLRDIEKLAAELRSEVKQLREEAKGKGGTARQFVRADT